MRRRGFTLIEVIVAVSIVIILASLTVPKVAGYIEKAKNAKVISEGKQLYTAAMWSYSENGGFNESDVLSAINAVSGVGGITSESIKVNNSKDVEISFKSGDVTYKLTINSDTNGYTIESDDKQIFSSLDQ